MTCNNTMLGFAMDFENGIKEKKLTLHFFCHQCIYFVQFVS
jgi:hypothetical protein